MLNKISTLRRWGLIAGGTVALLGAVGMGILSFGNSRYQAGRDSVTANVRVDTVTVNTLRRADSTAKANTDAVVKRTKATAQRVDTLILRVPDSLLVVPQIAELVSATYMLKSQVDTLSHTLDLERATSRLRASVDSAALVSASIVITAKEDEIKVLKRRPQWRTVAAVGALAFVAGLIK